jgi:uncharacterized protein YndB with AHSA1/START domain
MSNVIEARRERVWRALTKYSEVVRWNESVVAPIDRPSTDPFEGQHVRWRGQLGSTPVVVHDRTREVVPYQRLRSAISMGSLRFDQTYTLFSEHSVHPRTRLAMKLVVSNSVAVIDAVLDRFEMRRIAASRIDSTLRSVQKWCENDP